MENSDIEYIKTSTVAEILGVSDSTVRRLADTGRLPHHVNKLNNHRKFRLQDVNEFHKNIRLKDKRSKKKNNNKSLTNIKAKSHRAHYMMHKYWGRKPANVVQEYINHYTDEGDTVLDPFMGSGVVPIESLKSNRDTIGIDINPMSKFIVKNTLTRVNLEEFKINAYNLIAELENKYSHLYNTKCPLCKKNAQAEITVWDNNVLGKIRVRCDTDGITIKDPDEEDLSRYTETVKLKKELDRLGKIKYPQDKVLQYVKRSGKERLDELFTDRALIVLSKLRDEILEFKEDNTRNLLLFCFTSMLPNVSNMLPADLEKATYKSGWVISKFWTPKVHTERIIFHCFRLRVNAIIKGKSELINYKFPNYQLHTMDSTDLSIISDSTIDYIFTDPPYGESIAYLALSQFWNGWLEHEVDYSNEIILDPYRKKDYIDYSTRMKKTFNELYRVLKDKHFMSFSFHNRDLLVWQSVMDATQEAGFFVKSTVLQEQAVNSGTQGLNKKNTLTGDFIYTFIKDESRVPVTPITELPSVDNLEFVKKEINNLITDENGITPTKLYEKLLPKIILNKAYVDNDGRAIDIDRVLSNDFELIDVNKDVKDKVGVNYKWKKK